MAVIGSRFVLPYQTVIDGTGVPIPGAKLFFYLTGTSTPQNTYSDAALTVPNPNPVVANGAGVFPNIFLSGAVYKVVLTDSLGNQIWTADPVEGAGTGGGSSGVSFDTVIDAEAATIAAGTVAVSVLGYYAAGDNGAAIYLPSAGPAATGKFQSADGQWWKITGNVLSLRAFGARGDYPTHDDTAIINAAFVYAAANGVKLLGSGLSYLISGAGLTYDPRLGHGFDGQGCVFNYPGGAGTLISLITANAGFVFDTAIHPFENFSAIGGGAGNGVSFSGTNAANYCPTSSIRKATIRNFTNGVTYGNNAFCDGHHNIGIYGCTWAVLFPSGLIVAGERLDFYDCNIGSCTNGIQASGADVYYRGSIDYCTNKFVWARLGATIWVYGHIEGNSDNDVWLLANDTNSSVTHDSGQLAITGPKSVYPVGRATDNGACAINLGNVDLFNNGGWPTYQIGYLIDGWGSPGHLTHVDILTDAAPPTHNYTSLLVDGGFEKGVLYDWTSTGTSVVTVTNTQYHSGVYSAEFNPANGQTAILQEVYTCGPGAQPSISLWLLTAGISTDIFRIFLEFVDAFGADVAPGNIVLDLSGGTLPVAWTNYKVRPFNSAPPGTALLKITLFKGSAAGGNSNGVGQAYVDDIVVEIPGYSPKGAP